MNWLISHLDMAAFAWIRKWAFLSVWIATALCGLTVAADENPASQAVFFESKVRPLLIEHCFKCHGESDQKGGLRLDTRGQMLLGGDSGAAIVPGHPEQSLLIDAVKYESYQMPPSQQLSANDVEILSAWIQTGAYWPGDDGTVAKRSASKEFSEEDRSWWAYQRVKKPELPQIRNQQWVRNEIDVFIAHAHEQQNLTPAPEADKRTLIRRLYFDLLGIPPSPEDIQRFIEDPSPSAYEQLVNSLLDRPEYAERWARHWLDLVRYAESDGYRADDYRPEAWRYRDYVIRSFREDKPYDRFVQEQIAGDELFPDDPQALIATGYLRHGIYEYNALDVRGQWNVILNEITDTTSDVFLGLGLQCARCHDHKFDPLLQRDYYRLRAFFEPLLPRDDRFAATKDELTAYSEGKKRFDEKTAQLAAELNALEETYLKQAQDAEIRRFPDDIQEIIRKPVEQQTPEEHQLWSLAWRQIDFRSQGGVDARAKGQDKEKILELRRKLAAFSTDLPKSLPTPMSVSDIGPQSSPTVIPKKQVEVEPGFPTILQAEPADLSQVSVSNSTGRRATLAKWLTNPENPLTTRVVVNRLWQYHFGRGLAENSSDFGKLGSAPTHPELLDWLTSRFVEGGWKFKEMHRLMLLSATYRQSAIHPEFVHCQTLDPANRWLWRAQTRRLDAEQIRDSILTVTGDLKSDQGGPGVHADQPRRSIYTRIMRNSRDPLLDAFDLPQFFNSTPTRDTTTSPVQSLLLINSQTMLDHADRLFRRVEKATAGTDASVEERMRQLWWFTLGREPTAEEISTGIEFLQEQTELIRKNQNRDALPKVPTAKMPYRDGQALLMQLPLEQLSIPLESQMSGDAFTIETFFQLRSIYSSGEVRTLISKLNAFDKTGWIFGVTGEKSQRKPQTLVLVLYGHDVNGRKTEVALFSDQYVEINKPYYVAVSLLRATESAPGKVTFFLKDLANDDQPLLVAEMPHDIADPFQNDTPLTLGAHSTNAGLFDGLLDDIRLSRGMLAQSQLLYTSEISLPETIGYWQFEPVPGLLKDSSSSRVNIRPANGSAQFNTPEESAFINLCHVLLNSNEFLYVE